MFPLMKTPSRIDVFAMYLAGLMKNFVVFAGNIISSQNQSYELNCRVPKLFRTSSKPESYYSYPP